ncbi:OmpP1/FadL family transporter [Desulforhopalus singaporensis]|uniref:Long-chain fatty acid transport protein n=1 Tax=Desulforhopalus singaporensis TaxID=91360 RepID=A0A1H0L5U3_9BACT|nr:outer membrane protein transport protein [Desulforhopalus singaporensis]SDO63597.1 long-chain fatty acid transport protein [Desulforhopalus singaporensis]
MKKKISVLALASVVVAGSAMASGWRIPEQSVDSTAKVGANIASSTRADVAYYNPANMSFMDDTWHTQLNATYIYLAPNDYTDARTPMFNHESEAEHFILPTGFVVSPDYGGARFGLSVVAPYGLTKRWENGYGQAYAEEFSLMVIEVNPVVSYSLGDKISVAVGPRMLYADATVKSDASVLGLPLSRDMDGDTVEWGWNAAIAVKPSDKLNIAATYRSNVDLDFEDRADLNLMGFMISPEAEVSVPAPAVLALSVAYDVMDNLNVEFTWDRTFWSEYETLDFNFTPQIPGNPFEPALDRNWDDTDAFRIGLTYGLNEKIDLMAGFGIDENPIPTPNVDFSIPDSDAWLYSVGMQYAVSEKMDLGISALYDYKETREVKVDPAGAVYGEFKNAAAVLVTVGLDYRF